jgi:hypothetical protein
MSMLPLDDELWQSLEGGYGIPYDASVPLRALEQADDLAPIWDELWNELHHQGDVGIASYAAVPHLVRIAKARDLADWNVYAIAATIESARLAEHTPSLPEWLESGYASAWRDLLVLGLEHLRSDTDEVTTRSILATVAIAKGLSKLGRLLTEFDESEIDELYGNLYESDD